MPQTTLASLVLQEPPAVGYADLPYACNPHEAQQPPSKRDPRWT